MNKFGLVLKQKEAIDGLTKSEIMDLFDMLNDTKAYPIELEAKEHECSAMGFITPETAEFFDYDYKNSGLHDFIAMILDNANLEEPNCIYTFNGIKIWLSY